MRTVALVLFAHLLIFAHLLSTAAEHQACTVSQAFWMSCKPYKLGI